MNKNPIFSRENSIVTQIVLVDGLTRTGKGMLGPILASFDRVEMERMEEIVEYIGTYHKFGKISDDAATSLLRLRADQFLYYGLIGRNTNFRPADHSSIWNTVDPSKMVKRLYHPGGEEALKEAQDLNPILQNQTHDQLQNFRIFHKAFGEKLRFLEMIRHPVELVDSWVRRGWPFRFGKDPLSFTLEIEYEGRSLPFYAAGWEKEYDEAQGLSKVIKTINSQWRWGLDVYRSLTEAQQKQVLFIPHEHFFCNPEFWLRKMEAFLGTTVTEETKVALVKERCPRAYDVTSREEKYERLIEEISVADRQLLDKLIVEYFEIYNEVTQTTIANREISALS